MTTTRSADVPLLQRGEFFGRVTRRLELGPVVWVELAELALAPVPRHTHAAAHVCLPFRGHYAAAAPGWTERPALGVLFHPAGTTHADRFLSAGGRCLTLTFDAHWMCELFGTALPERSCAQHDPLCVTSALRALRAGSAEAAELEEAALLVLASFAPRLGARQRATPPWLHAARRALLERFAQPVRVRELARTVGVHPVVLARGFRRALGCTPLEFLRRVRVREALRRLRWSSAGLAEIALASGFADQAQLTRAFRRETDWTPGALRAVVRGARAALARGSKATIRPAARAPD